ncbi:hypothetical protein BGZ70_002792 [Mortierella alpina]|uniref:Uncharacterized protein n=1 Tax=Mortierella alpina TaxID=64518 RepID=A0A9P6JB60_MORAP|nr:hypothetical protein BGZ70_002792 [Mortierella alpina]
MTRYQVNYDNIEAFFENGSKVNEVIEKDSGEVPIQTKSLPPQLLHLKLSQEAVEKLKALSGVFVRELKDD